MSTLPFADTHNLVAFLSKPAESKGFEQIVDFLNASSIRYAITVNPTIYTSCIQQLWATVKVKTVNGELTLMGYEKLSQKLTFYKAFFSLQWKFLIHTILQCLSAKTTAWNEFSSTMASAIICLATNQKFNFSKYIFDSMVKNVDNVNKFLMYPRFVQVFVNQQVGDMSNHKRIYVTPSHTKKVFGNMKREGKGFSGRVTPLFPTMMKKQKPRKPKRKDTEAPQPSGPTTNVADEAFTEENVTKHSNDPLLSGEDSIKLEELMELCTNLQQRVIDLETTKTTQGSKIASLKRRVKKLEKKNKSRTHKLKRLYKVGLSRRVESSDEASLGDQEDASKQGRKIDDIDTDARITLVNDTQGGMFSTADLVTTAGKVVTTANVEDKIEIDYEMAQRLQAEEEEYETREESSSKRAGEALEQESSKKQKLEEDKESEELKQCLEIIPDDGDDVTIDATPLSTKSPSIMLKNYNREELEVLWSIVKARFKKTEPVNYMDNFLLLNLKTMFEHHVEDNVWKNQQGLVKVLNWKLYDSYGVHCVTMQNILYYLFVEKMYPLTNHTLHQMFNDVKLQVDYECEMAFELLRLVKKQLKEGYVPE
ncbi:hypothetical protein Tco_1074945 [Tanacetum coccineum]